MQIHKILFCFRDVRCLLFYNSDLVRTLLDIYDLGCDRERYPSHVFWLETMFSQKTLVKKKEEKTNLHSWLLTIISYELFTMWNTHQSRLKV